MADKDILACRIASYGKFSLHSYEHLPEIGVKYIERPLPQGGEDVDMLKDILEEFNLDVSSFQMNFTPLDQKEFQAEIDSIIEMSVTFGTKIIFTSIKAPELNLLFYKKKKTKRLFEQLRYLGDQVKSKGIHISLETHPNLVTNGKVGKESMEAINHDNIRINFDTANMYYYNKGIDVVEELDYILPYVKSVHLKDSNKAYHGWDFPALGDGSIDFPAIVKKLSGAGFNGPYTMEIEGVKGEDLNLDQTKDRMKKCVDYISTVLNL